MAISITVGTNSYISLADAETYFEGRLNSDSWDDASEDNKNRALVSATRNIDRQFLEGEKYSSDQILEFPRTIDETTTIPTSVEEATCEEAISQLEEGYQIKKDIRDGLKSKKVGDMSKSYNSNTSRSGTRLYSSEATSLLKSYLKRTVRFR